MPYYIQVLYYHDYKYAIMCHILNLIGRDSCLDQPHAKSWVIWSYFLLAVTCLVCLLTQNIVMLRLDGTEMTHKCMA